MTIRPSVGVAAIVIKDHKVLLGKRKKAHGAGTWAFPGGHLKFNGSIEECAKREVFEETEIHIKNIRCGTFTNDIFREDQKHYVTLFVFFIILIADMHLVKSIEHDFTHE